MTWWQTLPVFGGALVIFLVPGLIFALAAGMRGLQAVLAAPILSAAMVGVLSLLFPFGKVGWNPLTFFLGVLLLSALAYAVRILIRRRIPEAKPEPLGRRRNTIAVLSLLLAVLLIAATMMSAIMAPENISQTYDNVFHLNAVRWALDSANASPMNLGAFTGISLYPAEWHAFVALVVALTGASIPVAVNVTAVVVGAVVWPFGAMLLVRTVCGTRNLPTIVGAVFSAGFSAFPILMINWGVLYPNLLSIALLPAAIALGLSALGISKLHRNNAAVAWLLALIAVAATTLAHPSTLIALLAFILPAGLGVYSRQVLGLSPRKSGPDRKRFLIVTGALIALLLAFAALWKLLRPPADAANWGPIGSPSQAVGEILLASPIGLPPAVIVGLSALVGMVAIWRQRRQRWLIGTFLIAAVLYFYAAGLNESPRWLLTGVWYYDSRRLAALLPVATIVPAVIGATLVIGRIQHWLRQGATKDGVLGRALRWLAGSKPKRRVAIGAVSVLAIALTQIGITTTAAQNAAWAYRITDASALLSTDELALLNRLDQETGAEDVLAGLPSSGTALAYAFANRKVIQPHILTTHGEDVDIVNAGLKDAASFPAVCEAVRELKVKYVLDFGTRTVTGTLPGYGGVMDLRNNASLEEVDRQGDAKLFKVKACWNG